MTPVNRPHNSTFKEEFRFEQPQGEVVHAGTGPHRLSQSEFWLRVANELAAKPSEWALVRIYDRDAKVKDALALAKGTAQRIRKAQMKALDALTNEFYHFEAEVRMVGPGVYRVYARYNRRDMAA